MRNLVKAEEMAECGSVGVYFTGGGTKQMDGKRLLTTNGDSTETLGETSPLEASFNRLIYYGPVFWLCPDFIRR